MPPDAAHGGGHAQHQLRLITSNYSLSVPLMPQILWGDPVPHVYLQTVWLLELITPYWPVDTTSQGQLTSISVSEGTLMC